MFKKTSFIFVLTMIMILSIMSTALGASSAPTGVTVTAGDMSLAVQWTASVGAESYNVYVNGVKKNITPILGVSYTATGLTNGTVYAITVTSYDELDSTESAPTVAVNGTPTASTTVSFMAMVSGVFTSITNGLSVFVTAPLSYFVALAFAAAGVGIAKSLIPRKKSK